MANANTGAGSIAEEVGTRDDLKQATEGEQGGPTNANKADKVQPNIPTRADNEGANG